MAKKRKCGVLLPISSLPSKYGIGCFDKKAYEFVDALKLPARVTGRSCRWGRPAMEILHTSPSPLLLEIHILSAWKS